MKAMQSSDPLTGYASSGIDSKRSVENSDRFKHKLHRQRESKAPDLARGRAFFFI